MSGGLGRFCEIGANAIDFRLELARVCEELLLGQVQERLTPGESFDGQRKSVFACGECVTRGECNAERGQRYFGKRQLCGEGEVGNQISPLFLGDSWVPSVS